MLEISQLETGYGKKQVIFGISLEVHQGEVVALIGPNGAGKSTVLKAVCGLIPAWKGEIRFNGRTAPGGAKSHQKGASRRSSSRVAARMAVEHSSRITHCPRLRRIPWIAGIASPTGGSPEVHSRELTQNG